MVGRIKNLSSGNRSGYIHAENGQTVYFGRSEVWEHDIALLTVGQAVSFELQAGDWPKAANVHLYENAARPAEKPEGAVHLRYLGFEQAANIRTFRFQAVIPGDDTKIYLVKADLALFLKHHVGIQEGPALCLRMLGTDSGAACFQNLLQQTPLTEEHFLAHVASKVEAAARKAIRRRPRIVRHAVPAHNGH